MAGGGAACVTLLVAVRGGWQSQTRFLPLSSLLPLTLPFQVGGQAAFFVALFRKQSREAVFELLERVVPDALPGLHLKGLTPAQASGACGDGMCAYELQEDGRAGGRASGSFALAGARAWRCPWSHPLRRRPCTSS